MMDTTCTLARSALAVSLAFGLGLPAWAQEGGFFEDAKGGLTLRNYYFNRDFRDPGAAKGKVEEWAQGFIFKFSSGYTPGLIGFGLDGIALFGVKLDSGGGTSGSELLPVHDDGRAADDYGRAGLAAKLRMSATELKVGELLPDIPLLRYDDGRLLPQTFRGAMLDSREIEGLSLQAGQYREVSLRHSSDMQDLSAWAAPGVTSDGFNYAGAEYRFNQQRTLIGAWHSQLEDIYQQSYFNLLHSQRVGEWTLGANLGYFIDRDDGQARIGDIQSRTGYALLSASYSGHTLYLGLQRSVVTASGCRCMAAVGEPWATTCSTATSAMLTSVRGKCVTTTTLPRSVCQGCWPWCGTGMARTPPRRRAAMARSGSAIPR